MRHRGLVLLAALAGAALPPGLAGQSVWTTQLPGTPMTARTAGLGGATAAMIGYAGSVFTNPAGLAPIKVTSVEATYGQPQSNTHYAMGAVAARIGQLNVGGGARYLRLEAGDPQESNLEAVATLVTRVRGIALGLSAHYYDIVDTTGDIRRTVTSDAAVTVAFFDIAALAVSAQGIGRTPLGSSTVDLPFTLRLGFSLNLIDSYSNGRLLATVERIWIDGDGMTRAGLEGGAVLGGVGLVARIGTGGYPAGSPYNNPSIGGTVVLGRGAGLDYAYLDRRRDGPIHLVGLRFTL